jgi:AGCS family alanine or glycine:cation symporter
MKYILLSFFLFFNLTVFSFSQNETVFTIQLLALRSTDQFPALLVEPLKEKGFTQTRGVTSSEGDASVVYIEKLLYMKNGESLSLAINKLCFGKFKTYKEALNFYKKDSNTRKYFAKSSIASLVTNERGDQILSPHVLEASDKFMEPFVQAISTVLFFDILSPFEENDLVYDDYGVPVISLKGDMITSKVPFVVLWLIVGAIFFTFKMNFVNIKGFKHAIDLVRGKFDKEGELKGEVSHFQALATALSATVGLGNIAGVAVAISVGGAGATLWMVLGGLLGMSSKFVECTLGVKYRNVSKDGVISGGPMYYLSRGLEKRGKGTLGKVLGAFFAVLCIGSSFGGGNMFQSNQAFMQVRDYFPLMADHSALFGVVLALFVMVVIIGGLKSIAKITEKIVPFMAVLYVAAALTVLFMNFEHLGGAVAEIFEGAFSGNAIKGGIIGVLIIGFTRSAFSNEAGVGSAAIAHSAVKTEKPITEGVVSLLEPFIDTVVICTMTALVIIITGMHENPCGYAGAQLTSAAFGSVFPWFKVLLMCSVLLFAFSTMISWSYYGLKAWTYLVGEGKGKELIYKGAFLLFIVIGATTTMDNVVAFSDMMLLSMAVPNIIGLYIMSGEVKEDMKAYFKGISKG